MVTCNDCKRFVREDEAKEREEVLGNWCLLLKEVFSKDEVVCRYFRKRHSRVNAPYIPEEESFPLATDEGYVYVGES